MPGRRYTVAEVRRLAQRRTSNIYDSVFTRVVSAWITAVLAPFGTSPNLVSLVNFVVGVGGCALIGLAWTTTGVVLGVLLVHLYAVLDSVDGELARLLNKRSLRGLFIEDWSAYCLMTAFPLGIALYLRSAGASATVLVVAVLYAALGRNAMAALRRSIIESSASPVASSAVVPDDYARTSGWRDVVENQLLHHTNIRLVLTGLLLLHVWAPQSLILLQFTFLAYMTALLLREAGIVFLALRRDLIDRELQRIAFRGQSAKRSTPTISS